MSEQPAGIGDNLEEWRRLDDLPDYEFSSLGRVRCCRRRRYLRPGDLVKLNRTPQGYVIASLDGKTRQVQRLICRAFHGDAPPHCEVAHNSPVKSDIHAENLRWDTHAGNCADKKIHGTQNPPRGEKQGGAILRERDICAIRGMHGLRKQSDIAAEFGVARSTISAVQNRYTWGHL